jgi:hypothetical protein
MIELMPLGSTSDSKKREYFLSGMYKGKYASPKDLKVVLKTPGMDDTCVHILFVLIPECT